MSVFIEYVRNSIKRRQFKEEIKKEECVNNIELEVGFLSSFKKVKI